ncbi:MAG: hypothetical protein ACE5FT_04470 [Candidatus Nanoarchaeia archaeon]
MNLFEKFKKIKWYKVGYWDTPFFQDWFILNIIGRKTDYSPGYNTMLYLHGEVLIGKGDLQAVIEWHNKNYEDQGLSYFDELGEKILAFREKAIAISKEVKDMDLASCSDKELRNLMDQYLRQWSRILYLAMLQDHWRDYLR